MSNNAETMQTGRLALRVEGDNWNAYYAMPETMESAIYLGSIKMKFVADNEARKTAFMDLMRECVADIIEETTKVRPTWGGPRSAPDHEKAGHT